MATEEYEENGKRRKTGWKEKRIFKSFRSVTDLFCLLSIFGTSRRPKRFPSAFHRKTVSIQIGSSEKIAVKLSLVRKQLA